MPKESERHSRSQLQIAAELPTDLSTVLSGIELRAVFETTTEGTTLVIKAPGREIESLRGVIPILLRHARHRQLTAPVIRTVVRLYDRPQTPLALETMTNIADPTQRAEFAALEAQNTIYLHFYDEQLQRRLSKCVGYDGESIRELLSLAEAHLHSISPERFDFDLAKAQVMSNAQL